MRFETGDMSTACAMAITEAADAQSLDLDGHIRGYSINML
jgi:hypothetical protein